jgi:tetratricopeptide (TPR) repeat protein
MERNMAGDKKIEEPRKFTPEFFEKDEISKTPDVSEDGGYWDADGYYYEKEGFYDPDGNYYIYDDVDEGELETLPSGAKIAPPLATALADESKVEKEAKPSMSQKSPKAKMSPRKQRKLITITVVVAAVVILAGSFIYYIGFVKSKENYDAQMKIGEEHYNLKEYPEAQDAFLKALDYKPDDFDATIALSDTFEAQEKYDKSLTLLKGLVEKGNIDKLVFSRLYSIYIEKLGDEASITAANELTFYCYENGINPNTELIPSVPKFNPNGGTFNIATELTISADKELKIYYTLDGSNPIEKGVRYKNTIILKENKNDIVIMAITWNEVGLSSLPVKTTFTIDIQFTADTQPLDYIGLTNKKISDAVGALYYKGYEEGGYYYSTKSGGVYYIFPAESFDGVEATDPLTDEPIAINPETIPLPPEAVCMAVNMATKSFVLGMTENVKADDFVHGLAVEEYEIMKSEDSYSLEYDLGGLHYSFDMKDKETVSASGYLLVTMG